MAIKQLVFFGEGNEDCAVSVNGNRSSGFSRQINVTLPGNDVREILPILFSVGALG